MIFMKKLLYTAIFLSAASLTAAFPEPVQSDIEKIPAKMKELPFVEENKAAEFTAAEKKRGFMLFSRPLTAPVFPESVPLAHERISKLSAFGARGQYVNLNFCVYPLEKVKSLQVKDSGGAGERELRHVAYWNIRFPGHGSSSAYRRTPTFLFAHDLPLTGIPAREPHRFLLTVKIPDDQKPGIINGKFTVNFSGVETEIPYTVKVLPFALKRDPEKKFSAYNYDVYQALQRIAYPFKTPEARYNAQVNQYRRMKEYQFDFPGTVYTDRYPKDGKYLNIPNLDKLLSAAKQAGLPVPLLYVNYCHANYFYHKHSGEWMGGHATGPVPPPKAMFKDLDMMFKELRKEVASGKYPELLFAALDEPAESAEELTVNLYRLIKENGFNTVLTQPIFEESVRPYVDYWCDQYFRPLAEVMKKDKKLYFCYPNFNSYELTDNVIMTRGGRMVYGLGLWKSNYNVHVPWIFYTGNFRLQRSGGGNFITRDGRTEMAVYWECFREGIIDGDYIYTLQDAIVKRSGTKDKKLQALLKEGRELLQKIWNSVPWAHIYQREGFITDWQFDSYRAAIADVLTRISAYKELNDKKAPSILVDDIPELKEKLHGDANLVRWAAYEHTSATDLSALHGMGVKNRKLYIRPVTAEEWRSSDKDGKVIATGDDAFRFSFRVDKKRSKHYAKHGRISMKTTFSGVPENLMDYDYLICRVKVDSNRRKDRDYTWFPLNLLIPFQKDARTKNFIKRQEPEQGYVTKTLPIHELRNGYAFCSDDMKNIPWLSFDFYITRYKDGDRIDFDFREFALVRFTEPVIQSLKTPSALRRGDSALGYELVVFGTQKQPPLEAVIRLTDGKGRVLYSAVSPVDRADISGGVPLEGIKFAPGTDVLKLDVSVRDCKTQKVSSSMNSTIKLLDI